MPMMRIFRTTLASLYLMASLFVVYAPQAAHAMSAPVMGSMDDGCHDGVASDGFSLDHDPCGKTMPMKHDGACTTGSLCFDKLPAVMAHATPLPVVTSATRVSPTPSSLRSGLDPSPDLRPPRLSV